LIAPEHVKLIVINEAVAY